LEIEKVGVEGYWKKFPIVHGLREREMLIDVIEALRATTSMPPIWVV
jgi:hypothetical protein